jgi:hypothetical protein
MVTPLMDTTPNAPGAAKFLLNWPSTDVNITTRSGGCFLARVQDAITANSEKVARPRNPDRVQHQFLLRQWSEIEEMLVERAAHDTMVTTILTVTSLWMDQFYCVFGFTLIVSIVYLIRNVTCAEVTALLVCYQLRTENHRWWWFSLFCSGSTAVYTFVYSTLDASRMLMTYLLYLGYIMYMTYLLYFGYMFLICFGMLMVFGMVGALTSLWFIRRIYGTINKLED